MSDTAERRRAAIGGDDCDHPRERRRYLGQMGTASFFECEVCGGAVVSWPGD